jgi:hypothetical protein
MGHSAVRRDHSTAGRAIPRGARFAARADAFRTTLPDFLEPPEEPVDLDDVIARGAPETTVGLARDIAAHRGRDDVYVEDSPRLSIGTGRVFASR